MTAEVFENLEGEFTCITWYKHNKNGLADLYEVTITPNYIHYTKTGPNGIVLEESLANEIKKL